MARILCAVGQLAREPYHLGKMERNIYSAEELCLLLAQSAQILDSSLMDPELVAWIADECDLPELAEELRPLLGRERALSEFVGMILEYVGFVPEEKSRSARGIVSSGQGMEQFAARMQQAGTLAGSAKPYEALEAYDAVLRDLPEPERTIRGRAWNEKGRIYAELFRFRDAAECYEKAYDMTGSEEDHLKFLAAMRLALPDSEYLDWISEHPEVGESSLELESRIDRLREEYEGSESGRALQQLRRYREEGRESNYEIALHQEIQRMKDEYMRLQD